MIDNANEEILTLAQAAAELPRRRRGRKTHVSTLYRWTVSGCRGVILESIQIGATRATSREALQRFFEPPKDLILLIRTYQIVEPSSRPPTPANERSKRSNNRVECIAN